MAYFYALVSAIFAALTSILAKIGISDINSNLATAIRTTVVLIFSWIMVFVVGGQHDLSEISKKSMAFLILSGLATGISWLAFYKALQMADASKVVPIDKLSVAFTLIFAFVFLGELASKKAIIGTILITIGTLIMVV
ncbi:EamA family transporter [uncultured Anaerococcus sp.]|uniref:EamA family transporter n=1 Tax=uncultured Anaerococcus sp. TaxID=293428 RepID=UPI00288B96D8|nr:EamA family transporter [uncultured Anaerococcus sp.]